MKTLPRAYVALADAGFGDLSAIQHLGRHVRDAGLIATGKRGRGAQPLSHADYVALLLAVSVPCPTTETRLSSTRELLALPGLPGQTCGDVLANLIGRMQEGFDEVASVVLRPNHPAVEVRYSHGAAIRFGPVCTPPMAVDSIASISGAAIREVVR